MDIYEENTTTNYQNIQATDENQTTVPPSEKTNVPPTNSHSTDLPNIKFSHNNPYLLQQPVPTLINQDTHEQNKDVIIDGSNTLEQEMQALLANESIFFNFGTQESGPPKSENERTSHTDNTSNYVMDTNAASNATIEGTKVPHQLYSSVVTNIKQSRNNTTTECSMDWPNI
ncbi:9800_t:CDS:2, partial [Gigaspora margarita]